MKMYFSKDMLKKDTLRNQKIREMFFEKGFSINEIYKELNKNKDKDKKISKELIKEIIKREIKRKDELNKNKTRNKMEKFLLKMKKKKEYLELYRKIGFMESRSELEERFL